MTTDQPAADLCDQLYQCFQLTNYQSLSEEIGKCHKHQIRNSRTTRTKRPVLYLRFLADKTSNSFNSKLEREQRSNSSCSLGEIRAEECRLQSPCCTMRSLQRPFQCSDGGGGRTSSHSRVSDGSLQPFSLARPLAPLRPAAKCQVTLLNFPIPTWLPPPFLP